MDSRTLILKQALTLFSRRGYDAVGIQEIISAAGLTKPTLYHWFGSKTGLLEALLSQHYRPFLARLETAAEYGHDLPGTLLKMADVFYDEARNNGEFLRLRFSLDFLPPDNESFPVGQVWSQRVFSIVSAVFEKASEDHGNMRGRHQLHAASWIGLVHTRISLFLSGHIDLVPPGEDQALSCFLYGIFS
jgi:TetR/AcrR family transcriptional regulator